MDTPDGVDQTSIRVFDNIDNSGETPVDFVDVNADGLPDRVYYNAGAAWSVQLNLGTSLAPAVAWPGGPHGFIRDSRSDTGNTRTDVIDWNGDGFVDWVDAKNDNAWIVKFGTPSPVTAPWVRPGIMLRAHNGLRGVTEVNYEPSTRFANTLLPFVAWVVAAIRRSDGLCATTAADPFDPTQNSCIGAGHELVKRYTYSDGLFDGTSREFRGFGQVIEENPSETANRRIIDFSQEDHTRGKVLSDQVQLYIGPLVLTWKTITRETFQWTTQINGPRTQVYLAESRVEEIDPPFFGTQCLLTRNEPPDEFGRVGATCSMSCAAPPQGVPKSCNTQNSGQVTTTTTWANPSSGYSVRERPWSVLTKQQGQTDPLAKKVFAYDNQPEGITTKGNVTSVRTELVGGSAADHATVTTSYDGTFGNVTGVTDPRDSPSTSEYSGTPGTPFQLYPSKETDRLGFAVLKQWAIQHGEPIRVEGPNGDITLYRYDALGRVDCEAREELGESLTNCMLGGAFDRLREYRYTYASASATTFEGKLSCAEVREREPANTTSGYVSARTCFDALGRKRYSTEERVIGSATAAQTVIVDHTDYDAGGRASKVYSRYVGPATETPTVAVTTYNYEFNGISGRFDPLGRPRLVTPPDGRGTATEYSGAWTHTYFPWPNGSNKTSSEKDAFGREITRILYEGFSTHKMRFDYTYDGLDRLLSAMVDQNLATKVTYTFDSFGNQRTVVDPDSGTWATRYDKNGNPTYQNDPVAGQHVQWCYDAGDRVKLRCLYTNGDGEVSNTCTTGCTQTGGGAESVYTYDQTTGCGGAGGRGRLTSVIDLTGDECLTYSRRGLVESSGKTLFSKVAVTEFQYTLADRLESITYPDGTDISYTFKQDGQIHAIPAVVSSFQYDEFGRPLLIARAKDTEDRFEYHGSTEDFRLRRIETRKPSAGSIYLNLEYAYGPLGKVSTVTDLQHGGNATLSGGATYTYDGLERLTNVDWASSSIVDEAFQYNALGNITQKDGSSFSYDPAKPHQATAWGPHSQITYDGNGRRKQKGANAQPYRELYTYDALDRVREVKVYAAGVLQHTAVHDYDYTGQRVSKTVDGTNRRRTFNRYFEAQSGYKTKYYYAGDLLIASFVQPDSGEFSEVPPGASIPRERWILPTAVVWGLGGAVLLLLAGPGRRPIRVGVALPAARVVATAAVFAVSASPLGLVLGCGTDPIWRDYHFDHLGSTQLLTDNRGDLVHHVRYRAYGEVRGPFNGTGGLVEPDEQERWQFTGYESETESDLQYAGARYYDPELGQFLTHDPARQFASPYAYGPWDPMNGTDPNGEFFDPATLLWLAYVFVANFARVYFETGDTGVALQQAAKATASGGLEAYFGGFVKLPDPGRSPGWGTSSSFQNQGVPPEDDPKARSPAGPPPVGAQQALQNALNAAQGAGNPAGVSGSQGDGANGPAPASKFPDIPESGTVANVEGWQSDFVAWTYGRGRAYAVDSHGNHRVFETETWGGIGEAIGASLYVGRQWTNAQNVDELGGESYSVGLSLARKVYTVTVERNIGRTYQGTTVVGGASGGLNPAAPFGVVEYWTPVPSQPGVPFR